MIKELSLKNWKSFDSTTLYIDPLSVLIGANASGKSNILDAFLFLYRVSWGKQILLSVNGDSELSPIRGGLELIVRKGETECELQVLVESEDKDIEYKYTLQLIRINGSKFELRGERLESISKKTKVKVLFYVDTAENNSTTISTNFSTVNKDAFKPIELKRSFSVLSQIETMSVRSEVKEAGICVLENLRNMFILDPIPNNMRTYSKLSDTLQRDAANIAGVLANLPDEQKKEVEKVLTEYVSHLPENDILKIWTQTVGLTNSDAILCSKEQWSEKETLDIDARGMSDGTLRFLAILTALLTVKEDSMLIIEEIDNGLHPARIKKLVSMLHEVGAKRKVDILCTTHNPALLDNLSTLTIPNVVYCYRDKIIANSKLISLQDIPDYPELMAQGSLGDLVTQGLLERFVKNYEGSDLKKQKALDWLSSIQ